jgi:ribonuclease D
MEIHGAALAALIGEALSQPEERLPRYPRGPVTRPHPAAAMRVERLKAWRDARAASLGLDPAIVLKGSLIQAIAERAPQRVKDLGDLPDLRRWQRRTFGSEIVAVLAELAARLAEGRRSKRRRRKRKKKPNRPPVTRTLST